jgi:hypothetical protein
MQCTGSYGNVSATTTVSVNQVVPTVAHIIVSKIICSNESELPNWGLGNGGDISSTTASTFLSQHSDCHINTDWQFQWASSTSTDPGNTVVGLAGGPWSSAFSGSVDVPIASVGHSIHVREVLQSGYIPFTYDSASTTPNGNNYSAEMYCSDDHINYDNFDFINSPIAGHTYNCVAWNVLKPAVVHTPSVTLTADPGTINSGSSSTLSWTSADVTSCSAPWTSATSTSGTQSVSPTSTTSYTISCSGSYGNASSTATVTVNTGGGGGGITPTLTLTANPTTISTGATSTLTWASTYVTACSAPWTSSTSTSGNFVVSPATTTSYSMQCTGSYGNVSATTTVTVNPVVPETPTVTLTANPDTITPGATSTLTWVSNNTTACSAPWTSATSTSGSFDVAPQTTTAYTINCSNGTQTATSTATVTVSTPPVVTPPTVTGGGGCGPQGCVPGSMGGGRGYVPVPTVLGASLSCDYLHDYLHIGWQNDPVEMLKLQLFLKDLEGFNNLQINGVFDQPTFDAVSQFQVQFQPDILTPWGYAQGESTGYVYILTKKKINEIFCQHAYPLNAQQEQEIAQFRALLEGLRSNNISIPGLTTTNMGTSNNSLTGTTTPTTVGSILGLSNQNTNQNTTGNSRFLSSENLSNIAAVAFAGPKGWTESIQSIVIFFLILLIIYAIANAIVNNQNKNKPASQVLSVTAVRIRTALYFVAGLILALILCLAFHYYVIILPLLLLVIVASATLLWFSLESRAKNNIVTTTTTSTTSTTTKSKPFVTTFPTQAPVKQGQISTQTTSKVTKTEPIESVPPTITEAHLPEKDTVVEIVNEK